MKTDAMAVANWFIDKSIEDSAAPYKMTLLRLIKYVYIAYGYSLAILKCRIINPHFDKVEAWKYGPVITSVYQTFKCNGREPITTKGVIISDMSDESKIQTTTPEVPNDNGDLRTVLNFVWVKYRDINTSSIINELHEDGTPWAMVYEEGKCNPIPENLTDIYYSNKLIEILK